MPRRDRCVSIEWLTGYLRDPWRERIREYLVLMRMDRPVGALLLLWPTWWGLWFAANDFPPVGALFIFTLGVFVMRSAGCVINDYADHAWLDAHVERTRGRPMAAGRVSRREAILLFLGLLAFAFVLVLVHQCADHQAVRSPAPRWRRVYPFCKRYTHLAQVVLGAAFGWSIPMAFAAVTGEVPAMAWLLFLANVLFSTIYDTEYAMVDREDDIRVGAKSTAILFADADRPIIGILMLTFLFAMLLAGTRAQLVWPYFAGLAIAAGLFGWQQWTDPQARTRSLLRRLPQQQLGRLRFVDWAAAGTGSSLTLLSWAPGSSGLVSAIIQVYPRARLAPRTFRWRKPKRAASAIPPSMPPAISQ